MNLNLFNQKINDLENSLEISKISCFDFNPWPYIRLKILNSYRSNGSASKGNAKEGSVRKFKKLYKSFLIYRKNPVKKENVDIIYFTRLSESADIIEQKYFNRYADSFKNIFCNIHKIKTLEINDIDWVDEKQYFNKDIIYIDFIIKITSIKYKLFSYMTSVKKLPIESLNKEIEKHFGFQIALTSELIYLNMLSKAFMKILSIYKPKLVFLTVFYRIEAMAMSLACHRLGIRVVENQHGAQNDFHAMYTHWENIPVGGYELIPDIFWMWGAIPKRRIDTWATKTTKHKALIGGNLWMTYIRKRKLAVEDLTTYYKKNKTNILISLQGDSFPPEFLLDSIKKSSNDLVWHFRDHPRLPISNDLKNKIIDLSKCEIKFSSQAPLYELLKVTDIHITGFSTVAFEAQSFNIPTIFTHSNALNGYNDLINKNGLFYAANLEDFNMLLYKLLSNQVSIEPDYIVSDSVVHFNTLSKLMAEI